MQSFSDANLRCCECEEKFSSASALLHHFARHALEKEKQGNNHGEGNSRYDWQPWRYDDIFKTKRKGHNFLETALLSINETCRKRAKLQTATPVSTSSENSSHSLTEKSETSEAEIKGAEHSQDDIVHENQRLSNSFERSCKNHSKYTSKTSKATHIVQDNPKHSECGSKTFSTFTNNNSKIKNNIVQEIQSFTDDCKCNNKIPSIFTIEKSKRVDTVEENRSYTDDIEVNNKIQSKCVTDSLKGINIVEDNQSLSSKFEFRINKCIKNPSKLVANSSKLISIVQESQSLKNNFKSSSKYSLVVSTKNVEDNNIFHENRSLSNSFECSIDKCSRKASKYTNNEQIETKNVKCNGELVGNITDGSELVKVNKIGNTVSINNDNNECIVEYSGPEPIIPQKSNNLELPLELRTSETCFNRTNDVCDVVYDNDDNNINLDNSLGKVNCDNNNVIIYYNDNSQDKLPKIVNESGGELDKDQVEECRVVTDCSSLEEGKKKLSNRKQTTPKKIERIENEFLKIAPRPENLPRDDRVAPNKKGTKKKYSCPLCSRVFGWSTDLKRHILVHTGERPFKCTNCTSSFTRKFLLQKHQNKMHPLNGKTERERLLELKVTENLKQLKSKMLELQKSKESNSLNWSNGPEPESLEENNSDGHEEIDIKLEPPYEKFFKIENDYDENWDSTSNNNNNNNNNNDDGEMEFSKACKKENIVFVEPIVIQSS